MILDIEKLRDGLNISYFDKEGNRLIKKFPFGGKPMTWSVTSDRDPNKSDEFTNWDGRPVKRTVAAKGFNKFDIYEFIENLPQEDKEIVTAVNFPKMYSVDIETEVIDGFPDTAIAKERITTIAITTDDLKAIVLGWKPLSQGDQAKIQVMLDEHFAHLGLTFEFKYINFQTEFDMLYTFFSKMLPKFPLVTGWNWFRFDWAYLLKRARNLGINPEISSPVNKLSYQGDIPIHVGMIDYMDIYKQHDRTVSPKENHGLDAAGNQVLGIKKVKYNGSIQDMYEQDYIKYVAYNAADAGLVTLIHRKLKTVNTVLSVAALNNLTIYKASSAVNLTEALMFKKFYENKKVIADDFTEKQKGAYEGAYVKEPKPGLYEAIACFDFASLYPSVMRQINISPEVFVEKLNDQDEIEKRRNEDKSVIVSSTGAVFRNDGDSTLKQVLGELYGERKKFKKRHLFLEIELVKLKKALEKK